MIMKVTPNTSKGVYHTWCRNRLKIALADAIIRAVINDNLCGERFLVFSTDMEVLR